MFRRTVAIQVPGFPDKPLLFLGGAVRTADVGPRQSEHMASRGIIGVVHAEEGPHRFQRCAQADQRILQGVIVVTVLNVVERCRVHSDIEEAGTDLAGMPQIELKHHWLVVPFRQDPIRWEVLCRQGCRRGN